MTKSLSSMPLMVPTWYELASCLSDLANGIRQGGREKLSTDIHFGSNVYRIKWTPYSQLRWKKHLFAKVRCWWSSADGSVSCKSRRIIECRNVRNAGMRGKVVYVTKAANPLDSFVNRIVDTFTPSKHLAIGSAFLESREAAMVRVVRAMHEGTSRNDPRLAFKR